MGLKRLIHIPSGGLAKKMDNRSYRREIDIFKIIQVTVRTPIAVEIGRVVWCGVHARLQQTVPIIDRD
jgi:hypothetical protein